MRAAMPINSNVSLISLVSDYSNYDESTIVTPVNADHLAELLVQANYDPEKIKSLYKGFTEGFRIGYDGPRDIVRTSNNHSFKIGTKYDLWNKIMKEVKEKRFIGPYKDNPPFDFYQQSPLGKQFKEITNSQF